MTKQMQDAFLNAHNEKRRLVAAGKGLIEHGHTKTPVALKMPNLVKKKNILIIYTPKNI